MQKCTFICVHTCIDKRLQNTGNLSVFPGLWTIYNCSLFIILFTGVVQRACIPLSEKVIFICKKTLVQLRED